MFVITDTRLDYTTLQPHALIARHPIILLLLRYDAQVTSELLLLGALYSTADSVWIAACGRVTTGGHSGSGTSHCGIAGMLIYIYSVLELMFGVMLSCDSACNAAAHECAHKRRAYHT
jgi:hypothetical protein